MARKKSLTEIISLLHQKQEKLAGHKAQINMSESGPYEDERRRLFVATIRAFIKDLSREDILSLAHKEQEELNGRMARQNRSGNGIHEACKQQLWRETEQVLQLVKDREEEIRRIRISIIKRSIIVAGIFIILELSASLIGWKYGEGNNFFLKLKSLWELHTIPLGVSSLIFYLIMDRKRIRYLKWWKGDDVDISAD